MRPVLVALVVLVGAAGLSGCSDRAAESQAEVAAKAKAAEEAAAKARARAEAEAEMEAGRLRDLWTYSNDAPAGTGKQVAASIRSTNDVDTDGQAPKSVLLVFRDHSAWGRSSYLVLQSGDFNCSPTCTVSVSVDDAAPKSMAAHRPTTDAAIAMFIDDERALWRATSGAKRLSVEFPVKAGGTRSAMYDVAGLDRSKMPGWEAAPAKAAAK